MGGLFSGIGGWELGLSRAGHDIAWTCENDWHCRRVLERHFPVPCHADVRDVRAGAVAPVEVLAGGFPCQDISNAGKQAGIDEGDRSGLWREFRRAIGELRPRYALVENVPGAGRSWLGRVLGDLAALGYDAEWDSLAAADFGAPHPRERVWIVAYTPRERRERWARLRASDPEGCRGTEPPDGRRVVFPDADCGAVLARWLRGRAGEAGSPECWAVEPDVGRVAYGVPDRMERLAALGNALVPIAAEWIGGLII